MTLKPRHSFGMATFFESVEIIKEKIITEMINFKNKQNFLCIKHRNPDIHSVLECIPELYWKDLKSFRKFVPSACSRTGLPSQRGSRNFVASHWQFFLKQTLLLHINYSVFGSLKCISKQIVLFIKTRGSQVDFFQIYTFHTNLR